MSSEGMDFSVVARAPTLRKLLGLLAKELRLSFVGVGEWDNENGRLVLPKGASWSHKDVRSADVTSFVSPKVLRLACKPPNQWYVRSTGNPDATGNVEVRQYAVGPLPLPGKGVPRQLDERQVFWIAYAISTQSWSREGGIRLPLSTRHSRFLRHFATGYRGLFLERPELETWTAARLIEEASLHTSIRDLTTRVDELYGLFRRGFRRTIADEKQLERRYDRELRLNQQAYEEFNESLPPELKDRWLVFGGGEFLADGSTQREATLKARQQCGDKDLQLVLFRGGEEMQRLDFIPGTLRFKRTD